MLYEKHCCDIQGTRFAHEKAREQVLFSCILVYIDIINTQTIREFQEVARKIYT